MFTGLVETTGQVRAVESQGPGVRLTVTATRDLVSELRLGESVATDGACLTVISTEGDQFAVEASAETMARTTLGERQVGDWLHLERACRVGDRLGGHIVSGHIDATGTVRHQRPVGESLFVAFDAPPEVLRYVIPKGSVAIDGISLTVNGVDERGFDVVLIPHTRSVVHLHQKRPGARVNLEADIIGKYVERLLVGRQSGQPAATSVDHELLARTGFIK
jgi:riboflavin synthase